MTPHERALEAAERVRKGYWMQQSHPSMDYGSAEMIAMNHAIQTYITTMLDSPEMVDRIRIEMHNADFPHSDALSINDIEILAHAVIAAIKKEAGI